MKRRANPALFQILRSLVDRRIPSIEYDLRKYSGADAEIVRLQSQIYDLQSFIANNRYDRADTIEAESEIEECNMKIANLRSAARRADMAHQELTHVVQFYKTYNTVLNARQLTDLRAEYEELDARADKLSDLMFACQVNMDASARSTATCDDARNDLNLYTQEYNSIIQRMDELARQMSMYRAR